MYLDSICTHLHIITMETSRKYNVIYRLCIPASVFPVHACLHILEINTCGGSYRWQSVVNHLLIFQDDAEDAQTFPRQQSKN